MKKFLAIFLLFLSIFLFSACRSNDPIQKEETVLYTITVFAEDSEMKIYIGSRIITKTETQITFIDYQTGEEVSKSGKEIWVNKDTIKP